MARGSAAVILATIVVLASAALAQQVPATDSVAGAAREQKALNSKQKKLAQKKVYTNSDVAQSDATPSMNDRQASPETSSSPAHAGARRSSLIADQPSMGKNPKHPDSGVERSPLFDRSNQDSADTIVVPAGTKITVDVFEENPPRNLPLRVHSAKVVNIVQVGSTVVIPALSKVTIQESVGVMELTDVTIDGVRYHLQTDRVPLFAESTSEATFTLTRDLTIKR